ncbi:MAG TPA: hypothetical protein VLE47_02350 [Candidatus Saccharimonadales bacterium]|nr:hypothetical protein [Candidatus Saccharimonadales bacterium]
MFGYSVSEVYGRDLQSGDFVLINEKRCKVVKKFEKSGRLVAKSEGNEINKEIADFQLYMKLIRKWWWFF